MLKDFKMLEMIYSGLSIVVLLFLLLLETLRKSDIKVPKELQIIAKDFTNKIKRYLHIPLLYTNLSYLAINIQLLFIKINFNVFFQ